jgi:hypothetical protein
MEVIFEAIDNLDGDEIETLSGSDERDIMERKARFTAAQERFRAKQMDDAKRKDDEVQTSPSIQCSYVNSVGYAMADIQ